MLDTILSSRQQAAAFSPQLPAVALRLFCQAVRASVPPATTAVPSTAASTEAEPLAKSRAGLDPSADLHFFMHLLSLVLKAMQPVPNSTDQQQIPLANKSKSADCSSSPRASVSALHDPLSATETSKPPPTEKSARTAVGQKRKRSKSTSKDITPAALGPVLGAAARWTKLATTAASLLSAAQQLGVYRPNEDITGSNRAFLAQLATNVSLHVSSLRSDANEVSHLFDTSPGCAKHGRTHIRYFWSSCTPMSFRIGATNDREHQLMLSC